MRNPTEYAHCGQALRQARFLTLAIASLACPLGLTSCNTLDPKEELVEEVPATKKFAGGNDSAFKYCPLETVRQPSSKTGGLAALVAVMNYWEQEVDVETLQQKYPPKSEAGYPLLQLRRIATKEGLIAFALTMKDRPLEQVSEQLENGRPVIVPVNLPSNGAPGSKPAVETPPTDPSAPPIEQPSDAKSPLRYVVIFGQSSNQFLLMDPASGVVKVNKTEFIESWSTEKFAALLCSSF